MENKEKYGRNFGESYMCYYCKTCDTYVGCHNNTKTPLGTMSDKETREWRKKAHAVIDPQWRSGKFKRKEVYQKLNEVFGKEIHVGESDEDMCRQIIEKSLILFS